MKRLLWSIFCQAQHYFTKSLHQLERARVHIYLPFAHVGIADVCLAQGNVEAAFSHGKIALELAQKMNIKKALFFALMSLGHICQEKQEKDQARSYFEQGLAVAQKVDLKYAIQRASQALHDLSTNQ